MNDTSSCSRQNAILLVHDSGGVESAIPIVPGQSVASLVYTSGLFAPPPLCNGLGRCGRCVMRFLSTPPPPFPDEQTILGTKRLEAGFRLACRHKAVPGMIVETSAPRIPEHNETSSEDVAVRQNTARCRNLSKHENTQSFPHISARLAVDLGTTSLQWTALYEDQETGKWTPRASGSMINPQMGFGADVMSRVAAALNPENRSRMRRLTIAALNRILRTLPDLHGKTPRIKKICVAANPTMTGTLLNFDLSGLAAAPYRLAYTGNREENIDGLAVPVYFPAQAAAFVGGDISAGIAALLNRLETREFPFLYADLGTNGEFVLVLSRTESLSTSVPMGPALEGIGLPHGRTVEKDGAGTATSFSLTPEGLFASCPVPSIPLGISGTGYLSLVSCLLRAGFLNRDGRFAQNSNSPLAMRLGRCVRKDSSGVPFLDLGHDLALYGHDIEELLKVKAAFSLAVARLLDAAGLHVAAVRGWHMAGAMGLYVNPADLETLGFLPSGAGLAFYAHGNMSLEGAKLMLGTRAEEYKELARSWAERTQLIELTASPEMLNEFMQHMKFVY